jgi:exo-beta-1,3-glucanase (GH17 family)
MHKSVSLFTLTAAIIVTTWWWLGAVVEMPRSPLEPGEKLYCVSYAPFHGSLSPLDLSTKIEPWQIEQDLEQLSRITDCVRTYSVDFGLDRVPDIARKYGLKVLLGLWVSSHADRTQYQFDIGSSLARRFPDVIRAVIVGNEALLRGEVSPEKLGEYIRSVKSRVPMPVTYADVWEFWLRNRELASAVDFVTIHILPYWEDNPIAASEAASHVDAIRKRVVAGFPGKEVMIGEVGWPSAGRMREGALPSPANQARVLADVLARGKREEFRVNLIEAYDQPWKRALEGAVGGHWGLLDDAARQPKFVWGAPVSNHPFWPWQAAGGVSLAALAFAVAELARRRKPAAAEPGPGKIRLGAWGAIALVAVVAGVLAGWTIENVPTESLGIGGWLRSLSLALVAIAAPIVGAAALAAPVAAPTFAHVIGAKQDRVGDRLALTLGLLLVALTVLAVQSALALSFDPRYRDFPFAPLTAAAVPFMLIGFVAPHPAGRRPLAETCAAVVLLLCAVFIVWNETLTNWQALWFSGALGLVAISLVRVRAAPG